MEFFLDFLRIKPVVAIQCREIGPRGVTNGEIPVRGYTNIPAPENTFYSMVRVFELPNDVGRMIRRRVIGNNDFVWYPRLLKETPHGSFQEALIVEIYDDAADLRHLKFLRVLRGCGTGSYVNNLAPPAAAFRDAGSKCSARKGIRFESTMQDSAFAH